MMDTKKRFPITNIGTVSLMMIFIILCMVVFAVLSLSDAMRDYNFSQKLATHTTEYYAASNQAESILSKVDNILKNTTVDDNYYENIELALQSQPDLPVTASYLDQSLYLSWQVDMNDSQALYAKIRILPSDASFEITAWEEIQTAEWDSDNTLNLIQQ
jgi:Flp pilus assembly protein TadG